MIGKDIQSLIADHGSWFMKGDMQRIDLLQEVEARLEWLRLQFLEIAESEAKKKDKAIAEAASSLDGRFEDPVSIDLSSISVTDGKMQITLSVNLYSEPIMVQSVLIEQVMALFNLQQYGQSPHEKPPEIKRKARSRGSNLIVEELEKCLKALELKQLGRTAIQIAEVLYNDRKGSESWASSLQKTYNLLKKADECCRSAIDGTFPPAS